MIVLLGPDEEDEVFDAVYVVVYVGFVGFVEGIPLVDELGLFDFTCEFLDDIGQVFLEEGLILKDVGKEIFRIGLSLISGIQRLLFHLVVRLEDLNSSLFNFFTQLLYLLL